MALRFFSADGGWTVIGTDRWSGFGDVCEAKPAKPAKAPHRHENALLFLLLAFSCGAQPLRWEDLRPKPGPETRRLAALRKALPAHLQDPGRKEIDAPESFPSIGWQAPARTIQQPGL